MKFTLFDILNLITSSAIVEIIQRSQDAVITIYNEMYATSRRCVAASLCADKTAFPSYKPLQEPLLLRSHETQTAGQSVRQCLRVL